MARKKKVKAEEAAPITYRGVVTITMKKDGKVISTKTTHNEGSDLLFMALCYCIVRRDEGLNFMPQFVDAGRYVGGTFESSLVSKSFITTSYAYNDSGWKSRFNTVITYAQLGDSEPISTLRLCSDSVGENVLAEIDLGEGNEITLPSSAYVSAVDWIVSFGNVTEEVTA